MVLDSHKLFGASEDGGDRVQFTDESITSLKKGKGSPMEACLASRAIGLLTITVGNGSTAIKIMEQSLPHLEKVLLTPTHLAIVMEYAASDKLFDRILMAGRFSEDEARYFFQQLISGVSYCHLMYELLDLEIPTIIIVGSLVNAGIPILVYSGDQDSMIPLTVSRTLVQRLANERGLNSTVPYRVWFEGKQASSSSFIKSLSKDYAGYKDLIQPVQVAIYEMKLSLSLAVSTAVERDYLRKVDEENSERILATIYSLVQFPRE